MMILIGEWITQNHTTKQLGMIEGKLKELKSL